MWKTLKNYQGVLKFAVLPSALNHLNLQCDTLSRMHCADPLPFESKCRSCSSKLMAAIFLMSITLRSCQTRIDDPSTGSTCKIMWTQNAVFVCNCKGCQRQSRPRSLPLVNPAVASLPLVVIMMSSVSLNLSVAAQAFPDGPLSGSMPMFLPAHHLCMCGRWQ